MKRIFVILALIISFVFFSTNVQGKSQINFDDIYNSQLESSGAKKIAESLPKETLGSLNKLGIDYVKLTEDIEKNHNEYSFHNYIYIPLLLFCLADLYNRILNTSHMDELGNELICENV